jgi:hypothetical protein
MRPEIAVHDSDRIGRNCARVRLVVGCTSRKRAPIPPRLRLGSIPDQDTGARAKAWLKRLRTEPVETRPAGQLYAGDHWQVALSILSSDDPADLSIVSAGYGLITLGTEVKPYSATFSAGPDSVASEGIDAGAAGREWWRALTQAPAVDGSPRSLADLAALEPDAVMVVTLSAPYIQALRNDLMAAAARKRLRGRLIIVSAGTRRIDGMDDELIPASAELQGVLGGSRNSLNVRIARYLVGESATHGWDPGKIAKILRRLGVRAKVADRPVRVRMTDAEVIEFINKAKNDKPHVSKSRLLRRLRDGGRSCEQGRFGELFVRAARR